MESFILRTSAYYGDPITMGKFPTRRGYIHDLPIPEGEIINHPKTVDGWVELLNTFESEYDCKVAFDDEGTEDGLQVVSLDVFEPSWSDDDEAKDVIDELTELFAAWVRGEPLGNV